MAVETGAKTTTGADHRKGPAGVIRRADSRASFVTTSDTRLPYFEYMAVAPVMLVMQEAMLANFDPRKTDSIRYTLKNTFGLSPRERHAAFMELQEQSDSEKKTGFGSISELMDATMLVRAQLINHVSNPEPIKVVLSHFIKDEAKHLVDVAHVLLGAEETSYQDPNARERLIEPHVIDRPEWGLRVTFATEQTSQDGALYRATATVSALPPESVLAEAGTGGNN